MTDISIKKVLYNDIDTLLHIAKKTFRDAFYHLKNPADFEAYSSRAFTSEKILSELSDPNSRFYFAMADGIPVGYMKLNFKDAQTEAQEENAMEIERIYILNTHQSQKIGQQLIDFALKTAVEKGIEYAWLGVWGKNAHAIRFYERCGFSIFGKHSFEFGRETDEDWMMRKDL